MGVVVRRDLPVDSGDVTELVRLLPPRRHEIFAVPLKAARAALAFAQRAASDSAVRAVLVRGEDVTNLEWGDTEAGPRSRIRAGDIVVVDATTTMFTASSIGDHRSPPVLIDERGEGQEQLRPHPAEDVLEAPATLPRGVRVGEVVHRIELDKQPVLADLLTLDSEDNGERVDSNASLDVRAVVRDWLDEHTDDDPMARAAAELLHAEQRRVDVVVLRDMLRVVVLDGRRAVADEYVRQEWTPSSEPVPLAQHQQDVAERVVAMAERVGLPPGLIAAAKVAAAHHDDGKSQKRFQIRLGAPSGGAPLAKSVGAVTPQAMRRRRDRSGLPLGWRHEQRSVVDAWPLTPDDLDPELVARLIGTTHGHGRSWFPHTADELLSDDEDDAVRAIAAMLFDEGGWDELIETTQWRYGVWVCAYLEALVRGADGQISAEGR